VSVALAHPAMMSFVVRGPLDASIKVTDRGS
jgi:hypothetical protein